MENNLLFNAMSKFPSVKNESGTSSETSESQGRNDDSLGASRATHNWKIAKILTDHMDKKPPWRGTSASSFTKPSNSSLLKAKLLDASRRLRAGKTSIGIQAQEPFVKLVREASVGIQSDLIKRNDKEVSTDGKITFRKENTGDYILTHSIGQVTDWPEYADAKVQTAPIYSFFVPTSNVGNKLDKSLMENEKKLLNQISLIKKLNKKFGENLEQNFISYFSNDETENFSDDSINENEKPSYQLTDTISSWDFDTSDSDDSRTTLYEVYQPLESSKDMVISRRIANMRLSPAVKRKSKLKPKLISWDDVRNSAIDELINETNELLNFLSHAIVKTQKKKYFNKFSLGSDM